MRIPSRSLNTIAQRGVIGWTINRIARRASFEGIDARQDVRKYAAEQALSEEEALQHGMEEKSRQFNEAGADIYAKA